MTYWIVKPIINGFELTTIMFGTERELKKYVDMSFRCPVNYGSVSYDIVSKLEQLGFKVYCLPASASETTENKSE
jgi:hypothetical protein